MKYDHPRTNQFGIRSYIRLSDIPNGMHKIKVVKEKGNEQYREWVIPFYYQG